MRRNEDARSAPKAMGRLTVNGAAARFLGGQPFAPPGTKMSNYLAIKTGADRQRLC